MTLVKTHKFVCTECGFSGYKEVNEDCPECAGEGLDTTVANVAGNFGYIKHEPNKRSAKFSFSRREAEKCSTR